MSCCDVFNCCGSGDGLEGAYTSICLMPEVDRERVFIHPYTKFPETPIDSCWGQVIQEVL